MTQAPKADISEHVVAICEALGHDWDRVSRIDITVDQVEVHSFPRSDERPVRAYREVRSYRHEWEQATS